MARTPRSKKKSTSTTDATLAETLRRLTHDLASEWGIICGATSILQRETNSSADRELFELMQRRAIKQLQVIVAQITRHFPQQALVSQLTSSLIGMEEADWSTTQIEQVTLLVSAIKEFLCYGITRSY